MVPVCTKCSKKAWPPSDTCSLCFAKTVPRKTERKGLLIEFSHSYVRGYEGIFGIVKMDGFILVGSFDNVDLKKDMWVRMDRCGMSNGTPFYHFVPEK